MPIGAVTRFAKTQKSWYAKILFLVAHAIMVRRAKRHLEIIEPYLKGKKKILDVGVGTGAISLLLQQAKYAVTGVDVANKSMYKEVVPVIYDGTKLPYKSQSFDVGVIIWVLHHCDLPEKVLKEAMRVCRRVVVIENVYDNVWERKLTSWADQIGNWEFYEHNYLTKEQWHTVVSSAGWKILEEREWVRLNYGVFFSHDYLFVAERA